MSESLHALLEELPETSLTTLVLGALDYIVPGEWENIRSLERMITSVSGESDESLIQQIGERALVLYADPDQGYQRAVTVFQMVDHGSSVAGVASALSMIGSRVDALSFLTDVTPKPDTTQAIDAAVKLSAELVAFCLTNGIPGDSVGDFASAVASYGKEEKMRLAAWLALDCVVPLGPDFLGKVMDTVRGFDANDLPGHDLFAKIADYIPGDWAEKKRTLESTVESVGGQMEGLVTSGTVTRESVLDRVREYVEIADDKLDVAAAAIDLATNTFEHTGVQTVARRVVSRAYGEI
jgi:hypothetical protein